MVAHDPLMKSDGPATAPLFFPTRIPAGPALSAALVSAPDTLACNVRFFSPDRVSSEITTANEFFSGGGTACPTGGASIANTGEFGFAFPVITGPEEEIRHGDWMTKRGKIEKSMGRLHWPSARVDRFRNCGSGCTVWIHQDSGDVKTRAYYCHDRNCDPCARARAGLIKRNVEDQLATGTYLHVTLTLKSTSAPLRAEIQRLYAGFRKMRATVEFKKWTDGGAAFFEETYNKETDQFHPHLHCVLNGNFIPFEKLKSLWLKCTGDSDHVFVRQIKSAHDAACEVAKYASKPLHASNFHHENVIDEVMCATKSLRLCTTWGTWRGYQLTKKLKIEDAPGWTFVGSLDSIATLAVRGEPFAVRIWEAIKWKSRRPKKNPPVSRSQSP